MKSENPEEDEQASLNVKTLQGNSGLPSAATSRSPRDLVQQTSIPAADTKTQGIRSGDQVQIKKEVVEDDCLQTDHTGEYVCVLTVMRSLYN